MSIAAIFALLSFIVAGHSTPAILPAPVDVQMTPFPGLTENPITVGCTQMVTGISLQGSQGFGGLSAMRFDGNRGYFLGDNASGFTADLSRNEHGFVIGLTNVEGAQLADHDHNILSKNQADSEGLELINDTHVLISFENNVRVQRFIIEGGLWVADNVLMRADNPDHGRNQGLEGLTRLQNGRLLALSEGVNAEGIATLYLEPALVPAVISDDASPASWGKMYYKPAPNFLITEAATDPISGDLFLLERAFSRSRGPRARLVRIKNDSLLSDKVLTGFELARFNFLHGIDNMEGLTIERRASDGALIAHILSDDNFNDHQRTILLGLIIDETATACTH